MQRETIEHLARRIKAAQDGALRLVPIASQYADFDADAAYAVARALHAERLREGAVAVGRKIGFTNSVLWDEYGVRQPIWGYVYDRTLVHASGRRAICRAGRFAQPKIEPEIALHFAAAPAADADAAAILQSVDWIAHAVEIVQSPFPDWKFQAADTIAANALHGMLIVGEPRPLASLGPDLADALASLTLTLYAGERVRDVGRGRNVLGSPLLALAHLLAVLAAQPHAPAVAAGEIVSTGTLTAAHAVQSGDAWRTELSGIDLPGLCIEIRD